MNSWDEFWEAYPNKKGKKDARRAWEKHEFSPDEAAHVIAQVERFKASDEWLEESGKYIPHPTTFLNGERWQDEMTFSAEERRDKIQAVSDEAQAEQRAQDERREQWRREAEGVNRSAEIKRIAGSIGK